MTRDMWNRCLSRPSMSSRACRPLNWFERTANSCNPTRVCDAATERLRRTGGWNMSKTTYKRADRVADQIRMEVADILMRKIKDPRVRTVTVTDVELTADLRIAYVFVTTMEQDAA